MLTPLIYGSRFSRAGETLALGDWRKVFETQHNTDAHAWPYAIYNEGELGRQCRAPKSLEGVLGTPLCNFIFLDYDQSNDHAKLLEDIQAIPDDHYLARSAAIYPTKSGLRIVYRLEEPLTIEEFGPAVRGVALELARLTGLKVDPTTDQWTRCFRLPAVVRGDGKNDGPTWDQLYYWPALLSDAVVAPDQLPRHEGRLPWDQATSAAQEAPTARPSTIDRLEELRKKAYRRALRTGRFYDFIFEGLEILRGRRDQTLLAMAGEVVAKCFKGVPNSSAEEVFRLLYPVVEYMEPDGEPWEEKLWRMVSLSWNGELKKDQDRQKKEQEEMTQRDALISRMLKWIPAETVPVDPVDRLDFVQRHYCLQTKSGAYVVTKTGEYSKHPLRPTQLPAHFNEGLQFLVEGGFRNKQGQLISGVDILNNYSTIIDDVEVVTGLTPSAHLVVENDKKILKLVPFALRRDLFESAAFDQQCADWLDSFQDSSTLKRWLAAALALHRGPVAACYLIGPRRVGKSLLSMALAECFQCQPIPAGLAFSEFNGALLDSPVITVDEGLPTRHGGMDTADVFRSLVTGTPVSTQKKFQDQVNTRIPYRIIFAANGFDMVRKLIGRRTLDAQDREAFRERILVLETGQGPADYLDRHGAMAFTRDDPAGSWLGGECRLARHMMWLYREAFEKADFRGDGRLLVEGRQHMAFTLSFDLSGSGRDVVDELATDISKLVTGTAQLDLRKCLFIEGRQVWLKKRPYVKRATFRAPTKAEAFAMALDRFLTGRTKHHLIDMTQLVEVDMQKLLFCASEEGIETAPLIGQVVSA